MAKHFNASYRNIVGCNMLRAFGHPVVTSRHVGCCWLKIWKNGPIFQTTFVDVAWCCSRLARFLQQCCAWACALIPFSIRTVSTRCKRVTKHVQHVAPNNVAFKCCDHLAGVRKCRANNVGMCSVEIPGGTAIYGLYKYVPLWRVWFSSSLMMLNILI